MARVRRGSIQIERDVRALAASASGGPARRRVAWHGSRVQALLFDVGRWDRRRAIDWSLRHGFAAKKIHRTDRYLRLRQFAPTPGLPKRTISFGRDTGIRAVVEARA